MAILEQWQKIDAFLDPKNGLSFRAGITCRGIKPNHVDLVEAQLEKKGINEYFNEVLNDFEVSDSEGRLISGYLLFKDVNKAIDTNNKVTRWGTHSGHLESFDLTSASAYQKLEVINGATPYKKRKNAIPPIDELMKREKDNSLIKQVKDNIWL